MANGSEHDGDWAPVTARALAVLALHAEGLRAAPLIEQWLFLERLGMGRAEAARVLGTSAESLRVMARRKTRRTATTGRSKT